jgi:uncharacterized protein (TIGR02466 family)
MVCSDIYKFTSTEEKTISELAMANNLGNLMSQNDRILDGAELENLRKFIDSQLDVYKEQILRIKSQNEIYITQSWANTARTNQFHPKHKHPNSIISGVIFVTGKEGDGLPPLRFHRTHDLIPLAFQYEELNDLNSECKWFEPIQGKLILFPSLVEHDVEKNTSDKDRTTISFNTFARGDIGNSSQLTKIEIS